jgi:TPR repeat protein
MKISIGKKKALLLIGGIILCIIVILLMYKLLVSVETSDMGDGYPLVNPSYFFSEDELPQKKRVALAGDPNVAENLSQYYKKQRDVSFEWQIIGAENGNITSMYVLAGLFIDYNYDPRIRGIFWLYMLAENNNQNAKEWLGDIGYTFETALPPDDNNFPDNYAQFSETELAHCKTGALQGNRKIALLLGKYYSEIAIDNELSEYWYRIGAQNGSSECQYKLGQILSGKDDEFDQVRGQYWLDHARSVRKIKRR